MITAPEFKRTLLHPRYWLTWIGAGILYVLVLLPYPVIYRLGTSLGRLSMCFLKSRTAIADRNLQLCFPDMPEAKRKAMVIANFESVGMALFETGMAWFWPDWRIKRWFRVDGFEHINKVQDSGRGVIVIGIHFLTLELGARMIGIMSPGAGVYRPNDNPVIDLIQTTGRMRSNKSMIDRKDVKGMVRALRQGDILWYAPDHDYGPHNSVFAPFFAVEKAATITGTSVLVKAGRAELVPFTPRRLPGGKGYELLVQPPVDGFPENDEIAAATFINHIVEKEILRAPEQYMWLHRRFKTRPEGEPSLYDNRDNVH
ncbi:Kdo(2)-lipid IV(A) acyltransferase [Morganella psychrotolerans]|uniref:Kdo(2)-lipid IV(A) acyltransferase n=1 Tax=Morganella psychrotolerans TaxID=368603 RepID=UPI0039AED8A5